MNEDMWNGEDIFILNTTVCINVTDSVKKILQELEGSNIIFESSLEGRNY